MATLRISSLTGVFFQLRCASHGSLQTNSRLYIRRCPPAGAVFPSERKWFRHWAREAFLCCDLASPLLRLHRRLTATWAESLRPWWACPVVTKAQAGDEEGQQVVPEGSEAGAAGGAKRCTECKVWKHLRNFGKWKGDVDERNVVCRACDATLRAKRGKMPLDHLSLSIVEAWAQAKQCSTCKHVQEIRDFWRVRGWGWCRSCVSERRKNEMRAPVDVASCVLCGQQKPASSFSRCGQKKNGLNSYCKSCSLKKTQESYARAVQAKLYFKRPGKNCTICGLYKSAKAFHRKSATADGLEYDCKACVSEYDRQRALRSKTPSSQSP